MYQGKFERSRRDMPPLAAAPRMARGPRRGTAVFYVLLFSYILLFYSALYFGLTLLHGWLRDFEAAQPTRKSQEVFGALFEKRNWDALYEAAQVQGESRESFVSYMTELVGDGVLSCMETSAGLSDDKKYIVRLDGRKIAGFTLTDKQVENGQAELPDWQLKNVEFFFDRQNTYYVEMPEGAGAYADGVPLRVSQTVRIRVTKADGYLPEGVTGPRTVTRQITGLLSKPDVTVLDADGREMPLSYDEATRTFTAQQELPAISAEEETAALEAVKTYSLFMLKRAGADELARYFERDTDTYTAIVRADRSVVQDAQKREFVDEQVTDYCRYSDGSFSVRVSMTLNQYRSGGSLKETSIDQSLFFREQEGRLKCFQMTAVDVSESVEQVRLVFRNGETVLSDDFYETDLPRLTCPAVTAPEGKVFSGWVVEERDDTTGQTVMRLVFQPDGEGNVILPAGSALEPMELQPLFEERS